MASRIPECARADARNQVDAVDRRRFLRVLDQRLADDIGGDVGDQVGADAFDQQDRVFEVGQEPSPDGLAPR